MRKLMFILSFIAATYALKAQVLYGTTSRGGHYNSGSVCKLVTATDTLSSEFSFDNAAGESPKYVKLVQGSNGKLYGTTSFGGAGNDGIIFSYDPVDTSYALVLDFSSTDAGSPLSGFLQASDGKLYGMTRRGGNNRYGVIFSYDPVTSTYLKLHDFDLTNGAYPTGGLIQASDGNLYGMTSKGGLGGVGVIFSFNPVSLIYKKLKDFGDTAYDGFEPLGSLIQASDGNLYSMTSDGGTNSNGVFFSFDPVTLIYKKLKDLSKPNGANPSGSLIQASDGNLYGMTKKGGSNSAGIIFLFDPAIGKFKKLKDFDYYPNGGYPFGDLFQASDGKLYGMASLGGSYGSGVIFSLDPLTLNYIKLKDFYGSDGSVPYGSFMQAADKKLYGVTYEGGIQGGGVIFSFDITTSTYTKLKDFYINNTGNSIYGPLTASQSKKLYGMTNGGGSYGAGTIFSYDKNTTAFTKLKDFDIVNGGFPSGGLLLASDGKLYGTTNLGGYYGYGVIFSFDTITLTYTKLLDFNDSNGSYPNGSLIQASDGKLYGTTAGGGINRESNYAGVIFSFDPVSLTYTKLKDFGSTLGTNPGGSLIQASNGKLYGMTSLGGKNNYGVIFSYNIATSGYVKLKDFDYTNGASPDGNLIQASDGKLYGMTSSGGSNGIGVIFSFDPVTSAYIKLKDFTHADGAYPKGSLEQASDGKLYGMTEMGGSKGYGVAFSFDPVTLTYTKLQNFNGRDGRNPLYTAFTEFPFTDNISKMARSVAKEMRSINLAPNPAQDKIQVMLNGYSGNIVIQLSNLDGKILQEEKLQVYSKLMQQQLNINDYANGTYFITVIDEKENRQREKLIIAR